MAFMVNKKIIRGLRLGLASIGLVLAGLLAMTVARAADLDHPLLSPPQAPSPTASGRLSAAAAELQDRAAAGDEPL